MSSRSAERLALGTAQFGLRYGIANRSGQVTGERAARLLAMARDAGVRTLDTAIDYGDAEGRLGELGVAGWDIVSKLPAVPDDVTDVTGWMQAGIEGSLRRLGVGRLHGLLLHRPAQLHSGRGEAIWQGLTAMRDTGLVSKVGVSVYSPQELTRLGARWSDLNLVQAPLNVLDRSLVTSGWLEKLSGAGIEVHTRSAFLQGLLVMADDERPAHFGRWADIWQRWAHWLESTDVDAVTACLSYPLSQTAIDRVIVGCDSADQLGAILAAAELTNVPTPPAELASRDADLIDPSRWKAE